MITLWVRIPLGVPKNARCSLMIKYLASNQGTGFDSHILLEKCRYSTMVSASVYHTEDAVSITVTYSIINTNHYVLFALLHFLNLIYKLKKVMKWTKEEVDKAIQLYNNGLTYENIAQLLNRTFRSVEIKLNKNGLRNKNKYYKVHICKNCNNEFNNLITKKRIFCSHKCSLEYNNKSKNEKQTNYCLNCGKDVLGKFCNNTCKSKYDEKIIFEKINNNTFFHNNPETESNWKKKYLIERYGAKCMNCGWDKKHSVTNKVPIQLNHIDGNSENNNLDNLELLCPNCHSLTVNFGSLNKGNGRQKRREKRKNINKNYNENHFLIKNNNEEIYYCIECKKELSENTKSGMCSECYKKSTININKPNYEQLCIDINCLGYCGTGRKYNVSDNTIRNWKKQYEN